MRTSRLLLSGSLLALGCNKPPTDKGAELHEDSGEEAVVDCPAPGNALARAMSAADVVPGETAVGTVGDLVLMNEQAAYVITGPDADTTYWYYGGVVADAVAMDGCDWAGEDKLDEVGLVLGAIELTDYASSVLRAFRAESVEVLADGSDGGPAIVRATGTDDTHWLVEYELIKSALSDGGRPFSEPYGLDITVDYVLAPDSPVLRTELTVHNPTDTAHSLVTASLLSFGGTMDLHKYPTSALDLGPLDLGLGMPWLVATDGEDSLAFSVEQGNLAYAGVSGVDIALDANQALTDPIDVGPGESDTRATFLVVGPGDGPTATVPLFDVNPEPVPGQPYSLAAVTGTTVDDTGAPVAGARVYVQAQAPGADWGVLDEARSDASGVFSIPVPDFGDGWSWRLVASAEGRRSSVATEVALGDTGVALELGPPGELRFTVVDQAGVAAPARLALTATDGSESHTVWLADSGTAPVPPGEWSYTASRGYEYTVQEGVFTIPEHGSASLEVVLEHVVDTTGWVSVDTHVHSWDSPDSRVDPADVLLHAAAHGLDLVLHTEHEHIVDRSTLPRETGLDAWVDSIGGEEVTATVPEHLTMFPVSPDGSGRGGPVEWYGLDLDELFALMRDRSGGGVNLLNHPSYLADIGWDRLLAEPALDDPTLLGLAPDAALWSWDLDGIEVMNGHRSPFSDGNGRWLDWQSMLNAGHPLVAVGCSDDHHGNSVGFPRTYVPAATDVPRDVDTDDVVTGFLEGRAVVSAGAFARVTVDDTAGIGDLHTATDGSVDVALHIEGPPDIDVTHVVVFLNCDTVLSVPASAPGGVVKLSEVVTLPLDADAHLTVAAFGAERLPAGLPQFDPAGVPRALTSPVYIDADGDGAFTAPGGRDCAVFLDAPD